MSVTGNEFYDTFGDQYKTINSRLEALEKTSDGDLIVMADGTTYTMGDLGLSDVSVRVFVQSDAPTGLNSTTHVGDIWIDTDDDSVWFWDGLIWVNKSTGESYVGGLGLEALGPGLITRLMTSLTIYNQGTAPASPVYGTTWRDTASGNIIKRWDGSQWVTTTDQTLIDDIVTTLQDPVADTSDNQLTVHYTTSAPGGLNATTNRGDIWFDTDDSYKRYRWSGGEWVDIKQQAVQAQTDGVPPTYSPTPVVQQGIGSLFVTWAAVANADPVWYNLYISTVTPVTTVGANNLGRIDGTFAAIQTLPDGTPLSPDTTYYIAIIALDADGAASLGPEGWNSPLYIDLPQFEQSVRDDIASIDTIRTTADGKNTNYYQGTAPTGGTYVVNDMWFNTAQGYQPSVWNGTQWTPYEFGADWAIQDGTVTANKIASNSITASKISAGAVTADKLAANIINADAIVVGTSAGANMLMNPSFESAATSITEPAAGWRMVIGGGDGWERYAHPSAFEGSYVLKGALFDGVVFQTVMSKAMPINADGVKEFAVSYAYATSAADASGNWRVEILYGNEIDADGYMTGAGQTVATVNGYAYSGVTTWQQVRTTVIPTAGYKYAAFYLRASSAIADVYLDGMLFTSQTDSVMIADGAIIADKIGASAVLADKIAANAVTAGSLAANSVLAANIASGAITAEKISAGAITAGKISAGAIDGMLITGAVFQTATTGQRLRISGAGNYSTNEILFYSGSGSESYPGTLWSSWQSVGGSGAPWGWLQIQAPFMNNQPVAYFLLQGMRSDGSVPGNTWNIRSGMSNGSLVDFLNDGYFHTTYLDVTTNANVSGHLYVGDYIQTAQRVYFANGSIGGIAMGDNNVSTDSSGVGYFYHGLGWSPIAAMFTSRIANRNITVSAKNSSYIQLYVRQADTNTPAANVSQSFEYFIVY